MRGETVGTGVPVGDRHGDLFAELSADRSRPKRPERARHALQGSRRIGDGAEHVRRRAEGALDLIEQRLRSAGCGCGIKQGSLLAWMSPLHLKRRLACEPERRFGADVARLPPVECPRTGTARPREKGLCPPDPTTGPAEKNVMAGSPGAGVGS